MFDPYFVYKIVKNSLLLILTVKIISYLDLFIWMKSKSDPPPIMQEIPMFVLAILGLVATHKDSRSILLTYILMSTVTEITCVLDRTLCQERKFVPFSMDIVVILLAIFQFVLLYFDHGPPVTRRRAFGTEPTPPSYHSSMDILDAHDEGDLPKVSSNIPDKSPTTNIQLN